MSKFKVIFHLHEEKRSTIAISNIINLIKDLGEENMIGEEKFLSLLVVSVLVISGFAVISGRAGAEEGELVSEVEFNVVLNVEDGIASVYEEDTHMFMHGIDGWMDLPEEWRVELDRWEALRSYNNLFFNPAHEGKNTTAMQEAIDEGWIDEPEEVRWLANDKEGEWTVNPFAHNDIRFAMQYLNRGAIIEELLDGLARPEYGIMESNLQVWQDYFVESIQEEFGIGPEGDEDYMAEWIEKGMEEIQEEVAFGEVRFDEGYWQYRAPGEDWHNIEVIILARVVDWRLDQKMLSNDPYPWRPGLQMHQSQHLQGYLQRAPQGQVSSPLILPI